MPPPGDGDTTTCSPDSSSSLTTTRPATEGTAVSDTICPQQDQDYWLVTGAGGPRKLLNVNLEYDKLSKIELEADVWGPRGRCMPNALTACTSDAQCTGGSTTFCDTARGGCRSTTAAICYSNTDCGAGLQCYQMTGENYEELGQVYIPPSTDFQHRLNANYPAFDQGNYVVVVYDHAETEVDNKVDYQLTVTELTDVDPNEPNDAQNQATALTNNAPINGAMSYVGDVDWFKIDPLAGSPTIIKVTLKYLASAAIAPSWTLVQGTGVYQGPPPKTIGQGGSAQVSQSAAVVNLGTGTIYVQIQNSNPNNVNITDQYTLTVELTQDPEEGNSRNDVVTASTAIGGDTSHTGHIVASNDFDWYKLTRPSTPNPNSLVQIDCTADPAAPYSLTLQYWAETSQTCNPASTSNACAQGNPCADTGKCLQLLIQRPDPDDAHGDPQVGGRAPNRLHTELPILNAPNAWVRVANNPSTTLPIPGYDNEPGGNPYTIQFAFHDEPDPGDAANPPDNSFVGRPSERDQNLPDFHPNFSAPTRSSGATVTVGTGTSGSATGYITYDGDQDFFQWIPNASLTAGGLTITVTYGSTTVDLRATLSRDDNAVSVEPSGNDFCGTCSDAGQSCDSERATCNESSFTLTVPTSSQCSHTEAVGTDAITLWVNDIDSNDWDIAHAYTVTWNYVEGCSGPGAACPAAAGAACAGH